MLASINDNNKISCSRHNHDVTVQIAYEHRLPTLVASCVCVDLSLLEQKWCLRRSQHAAHSVTLCFFARGEDATLDGQNLGSRSGKVIAVDRVVASTNRAVGACPFVYRRWALPTLTGTLLLPHPRAKGDQTMRPSPSSPCVFSCVFFSFFRSFSFVLLARCLLILPG